MLYIFMSHHDNCINNVVKIKSVKEAFVQSVYVEDYLLNPFKIEKKDIVYILSNSAYNVELIKLLKGHCYIINQDFYTNKYNKLSVQKKLSDAGILVPQIIDVKEIDKHSFPIMCKSKNHVEFVIAIYTIGAFCSILEKYNKKDFYFEQKLKFDKEIKVYFVKDEAFLYDNQSDNVDIVEISKLCSKISEILKLEVFSIDILICDNQLIVIDVNPAAGLYMSILARKKLVEW